MLISRSTRRSRGSLFASASAGDDGPDDAIEVMGATQHAVWLSSLLQLVLVLLVLPLLWMH